MSDPKETPASITTKLTVDEIIAEKKREEENDRFEWGAGDIEIEEPDEEDET